MVTAMIVLSFGRQGCRVYYPRSPEWSRSGGLGSWYPPAQFVVAWWATACGPSRPSESTGTVRRQTWQGCFLATCLNAAFRLEKGVIFGGRVPEPSHCRGWYEELRWC